MLYPTLLITPAKVVLSRKLFLIADLLSSLVAVVATAAVMIMY